MSKYTAKLAPIEEAQQFGLWLHANRDKNFYDPDFMKYDATRVIGSYKDGEAIGYLPFQTVIMTESLAPKPGSTFKQIAACLKTAIHEIVRWAKTAGMGEIYFLSHPDDVETRDFAKAHGYEELTLRVMRLKLHNMQPSLPEDAKE